MIGIDTAQIIIARQQDLQCGARGPLGYKTLCNACGIDYMKQVTSRGSEIATVPDEAELGSDHSKSQGSADV
ncbi:hypothetical protein HN51_058113 [Arachis hypogaea]